jgi:hypothetical protein
MTALTAVAVLPWCAMSATGCAYWLALHALTGGLR